MLYGTNFLRQLLFEKICEVQYELHVELRVISDQYEPKLNSPGKL
jgi:hypothetical protein